MRAPTAYSAADFSLAVHPSVTALTPDAAALMDQHEQACMQFGQRWFVNLEKSVFSAHPGMVYAVLRRQGQAVAVLPLLSERKHLGLTKLRSLSNYYSCLFEPAIGPDVDAQQLANLFVLLKHQFRGLGTVSLSPMDPQGRAFVMTEAAMALAQFATLRHFCFGNWYLKPPASWDEYLASRSSKLRNTIKRNTHKLMAAGARIEVVSGGEGLQRSTAAYRAVYEHSWKVAEPSAEFIPGLLQTCAEAGALRLGLVWLHEKPIAAQLWIVSNGRAEIYKLAYDEAYKSYSPGTALSARMMKDAIEFERVTEVDYLTGDDAYKSDWMSDRRERWGLIGYNLQSLGGVAAYAFERVKRRLRAHLKAAKGPLVAGDGAVKKLAPG